MEKTLAVALLATARETARNGCVHTAFMTAAGRACRTRSQIPYASVVTDPDVSAATDPGTLRAVLDQPTGALQLGP